MKYKIFVATYASLIESLSVSELEYQVIKAIPADAQDVPYSWSSTHETLEEAQERIRTNLAEDGLAEYRIVRTPKTLKTVVSHSMEFDDKGSAERFLLSQKESRGHKVTDCRIEEVIIEQEDLVTYEYKPVYRVTLDVTTTKRISVDIDTEDHDDIDDEYDACQRAIEMYHDGDLHDELAYADVYDEEVEEYETIEE